MAKPNRLPQDDLSDDQLQQELTAVFGPVAEGWCPPDVPASGENQVLVGRVLRVRNEQVWVEVGAKSPGVVALREWGDEPPRPGDTVPVLLVANDDATGTVVLSRQEAIRWQRWAQVVARHREGDTVRGTVTCVVRGGLLVDIGFEAFLPASQVDVRRPTNLEDYIGHTIDCHILRIDAARRSIIVSRRRLLVDEHPMVDWGRLLAGFEPGQVRLGVVKNIADFGAFVDLGGIDGLLHVGDMFWGRGNDPRRVDSVDQKLEVVVLRVNPQRVSIALGLRPKVPESAWLTPSVVGVARAIAEGNCLEELPILADALEDAGCLEPALLSQLRGPGAHDCGRELIASLLAATSPATSPVED